MKIKNNLLRARPNDTLLGFTQTIFYPYGFRVCRIFIMLLVSTKFFIGRMKLTNSSPLAGHPGLEPGTFSLTGCCSNQLGECPIFNFN